MNIGKSDRFYVATHITGSTHNLLAIELEESNVGSEPVIKVLPAIGACDHGEMSPEVIANQVQIGVAEANYEQRTKFKLREIHFVANDSPSPWLYTYLARKIVEHIAKGGTFTHSTYDGSSNH